MAVFSRKRILVLKIWSHFREISGDYDYLEALGLETEKKADIFQKISG